MSQGTDRDEVNAGGGDLGGVAEREPAARLQRAQPGRGLAGVTQQRAKPARKPRWTSFGWAVQR